MAKECENKVMVAIDESESSHYALMWVLKNLKESITKSADPLVIFMAQPLPKNINVLAASLGSAPMNCPAPTAMQFMYSVQEQNKSFTLSLLEKAKSICTSHGVKAETITEVGDPKEAICIAVQKYKINLLVLGDRGLGKIKRAFLGSVSNYCVHNAKCPVLVVKKSE